MLAGEVRDQLLDQHRLADAGAAEEADLAAAHVRGDQVDDLDAGLEDLDLRREVVERRRVAVDRPALASRPAGPLPSTGSPRTFQTRPSVISPTGTEIGAAGVDDVGAARDAVGRVHRDRANAVVSEVLLHLGDQRRRPRARVMRSAE